LKFGLLFETEARGKRPGLFVADARVTGIPTRCLRKSGIGAAIQGRMRLPGKNLPYIDVRFREAGSCNASQPGHPGEKSNAACRCNATPNFKACAAEHVLFLAIRGSFERKPQRRLK